MRQRRPGGGGEDLDDTDVCVSRRGLCDDAEQLKVFFGYYFLHLEAFD